MAISTPYVGGLLLQGAEFGSHPKPHSSMVLVREAKGALALGHLIQYDGTDTDQFIALDAASPAKFAGVMVGVQKDGQLDIRAAVAGEMAVCAVPCCEVDVLLGETIAAGAYLTPGSTDGEVLEWATTDNLIGFLIEGGDAGDLCKAYVHPMAHAVA